MGAMLVELREKLATRYKELIDLGEKEERTADDESRIDALILELNDIGPKLEREEQIAAQQAKGKTFVEPVTVRDAAKIAAAGGVLADPTSGQRLGRKSIERQFLDSDELKDYRANPSGKSKPFSVRSFFPQRDDDLDTRTLIYGGALPADATSPMVVPGIYGPGPVLGEMALRSVLNVGTTTSDAITFLRELVYTNAAAAVAEAVSLATGAKPESALTFEQATAPVVTIAHWIPITRQALDDVGQLRSYLEGRLIDGLKRAEDGQLLNGNGTPPNMTGILGTTGVQALDATYFTANPVAGAGTGVENYNRLLRGITKVQVTGLASPSFIVLNPADWEVLISAVNANGVFYANGPFGLTAPIRLWGLPVVLSVDIAAKTALVGDGRMATIWDRMAAQIFVADQHADFFIRNIFVLLAEERLALTVFRPAAFAKVSLV